MSDLRTRIIRLAHAKPELRRHLLPLLKSASTLERVFRVSAADIKKAKEILEKYDAESIVNLDSLDKDFEQKASAFQKAKDDWEEYKSNVYAGIAKAKDGVEKKFDESEDDFMMSFMDKLYKIRES